MTEKIGSPESDQPLLVASALVNKPMIIIAACVLACAGMLYFFNKNSPPSTFIVTSTPIALYTETKQSPDLKQIRSAVLNKAVLVFPKVVETQIIERAQVPENLKFIILGKNSKVLKRKYKNGLEGYEFSFNIDLSLLSTHNLYRSLASPKEGWKVLSAMRGRLFGIVEVEGPSHLLRVNLTNVVENLTSVMVETISIENQL